MTRPPRLALVGLGGAGTRTIVEVWRRSRSLPRLDLYCLRPRGRGLPCVVLEDYGRGMEYYTAKSVSAPLSKHDLVLSVVGGGSAHSSLFLQLAANIRRVHIGIMYFPFSNEPRYKIEVAERTAKGFLKYANGLILLKNDELLDLEGATIIEGMAIYPRLVSILAEDLHEALTMEHIEFLRDWLHGRYVDLRVGEGDPVGLASKFLKTQTRSSALLVVSGERPIPEAILKEVEELAGSRLKRFALAPRAGRNGVSLLSWS